MAQQTHTRIEHYPVTVPAGSATLAADLAVPHDATGLVVFAHGSGSSRHSPRNRHVAAEFNDYGLATLLIDLLTEDEETEDRATAEHRFDIALLADRLVAATDWVRRDPKLKDQPLGYFGASTGAAAALQAAASNPGIIRAVVSRGGRPDLAGDALRHVQAPSLFIVGGKDSVVLDLNREAMSNLPEKTERELAVVAGATHLFAEPGALDQVAVLARSWFQQHLNRSQ